MSIYDEGAKFTVICGRCGAKFEVVRNWGGGVRREYPTYQNPALCACGSRKLEVY